MRWNNLRPGEAAQGTLFDVEEVIERTFDTPEFRGMTFYEVLARSIINKVPAASRVPFQWTINPYRGCTHACRYCVAGDTQIQMADGGTKRLADIQVGDEIYGTVRIGANRRQVVTKVLAHWPTKRAAYRVTLDSGGQLVASADHRFLTVRGWRHVDSLTVGQKLIGLRSNPAITQIEDLGVELPMYDITTGTGDYVANGVISHNCFARRTHEYLDLDAGHDFDSKVVVKINAPELVRKELASPRWGGEQIAMGTNVDCYQRAEGRYRLMPGILAALRDRENPYSILTKGTLILRDLDLLREAAEVTKVSVNVSVGFVDERMWRSVEPGTPSPRARLDVCRKLTEAGIGCGVLMAPILPFLTDSPEQLDATVQAIAAAGASRVTPVVLHLRPGAREWYLGWLEREFPALVPRYAALYGRGAYAPQSYQQDIAALVIAAAHRHGIGQG